MLSRSFSWLACIWKLHLQWNRIIVEMLSFRNNQNIGYVMQYYEYSSLNASNCFRFTDGNTHLIPMSMQAADCRQLNNHFQMKYALSLNVFFLFYKEMHSTAVYLIGTQPHWNSSESRHSKRYTSKVTVKACHFCLVCVSIFFIIIIENCCTNACIPIHFPFILIYIDSIVECNTWNVHIHTTAKQK